ncbi:hypothetical protein Ahy_B09g099776 isoform B [Arachis hypogaea]|uniref:Amino acid transporter transmembrane domain-containing protein n=1 Tax=Arachis hypogaea TaxID=3818 RepID=A0A444XUP2_ARAHY|nr:hypothetical protein Ahy_B09g099776 isoform B [Arachis hypogaea]
MEDNNNSCREKKKMEDNNKDINNWLAVTRSRNGKWWYSAFHNVTALVGAGVLGFPYANVSTWMGSWHNSLGAFMDMHVIHGMADD